MKRFLYFALFLLSTAFAEDEFLTEPNSLDDPSFPLTSLEGEPSAIVHHCVNAISGEYIDFQTDISIPGAEPLTLQRYYSSGDGQLSDFGRVWKFNHDISVGRPKTMNLSDPWIFVKDEFGAYIPFGVEKNNRRTVDKSVFNKRTTNSPSKQINERALLKDYRLFENKQTVILKKKGEAIYQFDGYPARGSEKRVTKIKKKSGPLTTYDYHKHSLKSVQAFTCKNKSFGLLDFTETHKGDWAELQIKSSHGQIAIYQFQKSHFYVLDRNHYKYTGEKEYKKHDAWMTLSIQPPEGPKETYTYWEEGGKKPTQLPKICKKNLPNHRFLEIDYYQQGDNEVWPGANYPVREIRRGRVMRLNAPVGCDATPIPIYRFVYFLETKLVDKYYDDYRIWGQTHVYDAVDHLTIYHTNIDERLACIERFTGTKERQKYCEEKFYWEENGNLRSKVFSAGGSPIFCYQYSYNSEGKVQSQTLHGNLTGQTHSTLHVDDQGEPSGSESLYIGHEYNKSGLLSYENSSTADCDYRYEYKPDTNLLEARYTIEGTEIRLREFFEYDEHLALTTSYIDNGTGFGVNNLTKVTERRIKRIRNRSTFPVGLPELIEERYLNLMTGREGLIKRIENRYDDKGRLIEQNHYGSNGEYAYTLKWQYNDIGKLIEETDAIGRKIIRDYDENGNLILEIEPSGIEHRYDYDFMNRLIKEEIKADEQLYATAYRYDILGNRKAVTDIYGNETSFNYDDFGRVIETFQPAVMNEKGVFETPIVRKKYDAMGNVIEITDALGNITKAAYTIRGKPYHIQYADGSEERFEYTLKGQLKKATTRNGTYTSYEYDYAARPYKKQTFSAQGTLLSSSEREYDAFHLKKETNSEGITTVFCYDMAGHLISQRKEDHRTDYAYDALERQAEIKEFYGPNENDYLLTYRKFDFVGQLVLETVKDSAGEILRKIEFKYDNAGNRIQTFSGTGTILETSKYNFRRQPIEIVDAADNKHRFLYSYEKEPIVEKIDPQGHREASTYDALGRIICIEHKTPWNQVVKKSQYRYDLAGNRTTHIETVFTPDAPDRQVLTLWEYDSMNKVKLILEAAHTQEQKSTRYHYNGYGELETLQKNDGCTLHSTYDGLGRLATYRSSDDTFSYIYRYDAASRPVHVEDLLSSTATSKKYKNGRMIRETLANGLSLDYAYDWLSRPVKISFPDQTEARYEYKGLRLHKVSRINKEGNEIYSHIYEKYDLNGTLEQAKLIADAGQISYYYDALKRPMLIQSKQWSEKIDHRDKVGNLIQRTVKDVGGTTHCDYKYNDLYQLSKENGFTSHAYVTDSLYNHVSKDENSTQHNALNQLLNDSKHAYDYDLRGNRKNKINHQTYDYDALDRLIAVTENTYQTRYSYDAFNRRVTKTTYEKKDFSWQPLTTENYLYLNNSEVGACDTTGHFFEFRLLGYGKGAELGSAIALELHGKVYAPIHDHLGHVACLLNPQGEVVETYRYSAFGEEILLNGTGDSLTDSINPWRYSGKRKDPETGFIYFGFRYYDPQTFKWISSDPLGYEAGPNLYAYVLNNPFIFHDLQGLFDFPMFLTNYSNKTRLFAEEPSIFSERHYFETKALNDGLGTNHVRFDPEFDNSMFNAVPSTTETFGTIQTKDHWITAVNGFLTTTSRKDVMGPQISEMAFGNKVHFIHNPTHGWFLDFHRQFLSRYYATDTVRELHHQWRVAFSHLSPEAKIFHWCFSDGVRQTKTALMSFPPELRDRIIVLAICPPCYIDRNLCYQVTHLCCEGDFVNRLDPEGHARAKLQGTVIDIPCPDPSWNDGIRNHDAFGPMVMEHIIRAFKTYLGIRT